MPPAPSSPPPSLPSTSSPSPPSALDDDLRETIDLLGTLMASVSDRVDAQTEAVERLARTAAETRAAAFAARAQTDPQRFVEPLGEAVRRFLLPAVDRLDALHKGAGADGYATQGQLGRLAAVNADLARQLVAARDHAAWWKDRMPTVAFGLLVLVLALSLLLPRLLAAHPLGCWALGGEWYDYEATNLASACTFDGPVAQGG